MQSNDVIELVTPLGSEFSEVTSLPGAAAVLAGNAGVLVEQGRTFHSAVQYRSLLGSDVTLSVRRVEIPVIGKDGEISGVLCRNLPLTHRFPAYGRLIPVPTKIFPDLNRAVSLISI